MSPGQQIIIPGGDKPETLKKLLELLADQQKVATVIVRRGERFLMKIVEVRKELVIGEVRALNHSPEVSRDIYRSFNKQESSSALTGQTRREVLLADAIDEFGTTAHRYRVYLPLEDVAAVYEDIDDPFDETPFLPLP